MTKTKAAGALNCFKQASDSCAEFDCDPKYAGECISRMMEHETTIISALCMLEAVESGSHRVVPIEPTGRMSKAFMDAKGSECLHDALKAMLQAAPEFE